MSDIVAKTCRCSCCNSALEGAPDEDVPAPSIDTPGIGTEEQEFVCNDCCMKLAASALARQAAPGQSRTSQAMRP